MVATLSAIFVRINIAYQISCYCITVPTVSPFQLVLISYGERHSPQKILGGTASPLDYTTGAEAKATPVICSVKTGRLIFHFRWCTRSQNSNNLLSLSSTSPSSPFSLFPTPLSFISAPLPSFLFVSSISLWRTKKEKWFNRNLQDC